MAEVFVPTVDHLSTHRPIPTATLWGPNGAKMICNLKDKEKWLARGWSETPPNVMVGEPASDDQPEEAASDSIADEIKMVERVYVAASTDIEAVTRSDLVAACKAVGAKPYGTKVELLAALDAKLRDA